MEVVVVATVVVVEETVSPSQPEGSLTADEAMDTALAAEILLVKEVEVLVLVPTN